VATHGFGGLWAGIAGLVWLVGRAWYALAYLNDPTKRGGGFGLSLVGWLALVVMSAIGIVHAMMIG